MTEQNNREKNALLCQSEKQKKKKNPLFLFFLSAIVGCG
jgi:hypothetical protein